MKDRLKEKLRNGDGLTIADRLDIAGEVAALTADKDRLIRRLERRNRWVRIQKERACALMAEREGLLDALRLLAHRTRDGGFGAAERKTMWGLWEIATTAINRAEGRK